MLLLYRLFDRDVDPHDGMQHADFLVLLLVLRGPCSVPQMQHCFRSEALLSILPIRGLSCKLAHAKCGLVWTNFPGAQWGFAAFSFLPGWVSRDQEYMCFWQKILACFFDSSMLHLCIFGARRNLGSRSPDTEYLTSIDSLPSWSRTVVLQQASPAPSSTGGLSSSPAPAWSDQEVVA